MKLSKFIKEIIKGFEDHIDPHGLEFDIAVAPIDGVVQVPNGIVDMEGISRLKFVLEKKKP